MHFLKNTSIAVKLSVAFALMLVLQHSETVYNAPTKIQPPAAADGEWSSF
jgi:hypothetical protein